MAKNKKKKKNSGPPKPQIQLSQCMIVKNEEKNIERALSWGKGIVFEQIVVDTGSTDNTVEIAERMGAKVFHFEWINDFAAAKNYAIEQATGNWIAFLDADEYFSKKDAKILLETLKKIRNDDEYRERCLVLNCPLVNLNNEGKPVTIIDQERVFRNVSNARYKGRIHEMLSFSTENVYRTDEISIIHTGYSQKVYEDTNKLQRNIDMLTAELNDKPDDVNLKAYLADAYRALGDSESQKKADRFYLEVINTDRSVFNFHRLSAYRNLIEWRANDPDRIEEADELAQKAIIEFPEDLDIQYFYGTILNNQNKFDKALTVLQSCEEKLISSKALDVSVVLLARPEMLYYQLATAARGMNDIQNFVKYSSMAMTAKKDEPRMLGPFIRNLIEQDVSEEELLEILATVYNLEDPKDLLFIARTARDYGAVIFAKMVLEKAETMI